jgi:hypothetical protein
MAGVSFIFTRHQVMIRISVLLSGTVYFTWRGEDEEDGRPRGKQI